MAFDEFERQVRPPAGRDARVVQSGDVSVREGGEDVTLPRHPGHEPGARPRPARQLQRHRAPDHPVGTLGEPDGAHAAFAELAQQPIRTDRCARPIRFARAVDRAEVHGRDRVEKTDRLDRRLVGEERQQPRLQRVIFGPERGKPCCAVVRREIQRLVEQAIDPDPGFGVH